jgi:hypothetical protein
MPSGPKGQKKLHILLWSYFVLSILHVYVATNLRCCHILITVLNALNDGRWSQVGHYKNTIRFQFVPRVGWKGSGHDDLMKHCRLCCTQNRTKCSGVYSGLLSCPMAAT